MCLYATWMRYFIEGDRKIDGDEKESNILTEEEPKYIISLKKRYRILVELRKPVFVEEEFCNEIF